MKKSTPKKASKLREWINALVFAVVVASIIRWIGVEAFTIPSPSMEQTLLAGDYIFVSKVHYGARIPITPLQIPLTHQTIGSTGILSYVDWIQLPAYRLPGFTHIKRGDKVVFNYPMELDKPIDLRTYYIKRCIGLPGDTVRIDNLQVYVNDVLQPQYPGLQHCYYLKTTATLGKLFFDKYAIREYSAVQGGYLVHTTSAAAAQLEQIASIQEVRLVVMPKGMADPRIYASNEALPWNGDHLGPITVPAKGMHILINEKTLAQYERTITYHEGHKEVQINENQLWIDGQPIATYTFQQDYYFMLGDNRHNSVDSRFWSFVPQDHIVGKATFVLFSLDPNKQLWKKMRLQRIFRFID